MAGKKAKIRLWSETPLAAGREVMLNDKQSHYLTNVMKLAAGDAVLAFDNEHGEFLCTLKTASKKSCRLEISEQTRGFEKCPDVWLLFAPVKKIRPISSFRRRPNSARQKLCRSLPRAPLRTKLRKNASLPKARKPPSNAAG